MERLKTLGTWVLIIIAFFIFSNIMIKRYLKNIRASENNVNSVQTVQAQENK